MNFEKSSNLGGGGFRNAFLEVRLVLIFLNTIVEKHTLNPEIRILWDFYCLIGPWWVQIAAPKYLCQITHQWGLMHANEILRGSNTDAVICARVCANIGTRLCINHFLSNQ